MDKCEHHNWRFMPEGVRCKECGFLKFPNNGKTAKLASFDHNGNKFEIDVPIAFAEYIKEQGSNMGSMSFASTVDNNPFHIQGHAVNDYGNID